jgi:hypothetical protein
MDKEGEKKESAEACTCIRASRVTHKCGVVYP